MFELNGPVLHYALDDAGRCASFIHVPTGHETVELPGHLFKLIYSIPGTEQQECAAWQQDQQGEIRHEGDAISLR